MKKLSLISVMILLSGALFITSCDTNPIGQDDNSILPEKFSVDIPDAICQEVPGKKSAAIDTLMGNAVYEHLTFFIHVGEEAADIVESIIWSIRTYNIDRVLTMSYTGDDNRVKNLVVEAAAEFDGRTWDYGLTITDSESEAAEDGGKAMQIFWNENPRAGIALLKPYNIDRENDADLAEAMFRIDYSEEGEMGYDAHMIVSIAELPSIDPLLEPFAIDALKMFVGKKGEFVDVYGNSSHPNAKLLTTTTGYNWAFVASGEENRDVAAAEVGLPLSTLDATGRDVLLEDYSIRNVFTNEVKTVWPNASDDLLNAWLANTEAPGFFDENGFVQGGTLPGDEYQGVAERLTGMAPYNPKTISTLTIDFK